MTSALYSNFFSSQTVSLLFCLQQLAQRLSDPDPENPISKFILGKIMTVNEAKLQTLSNQAFEAQMLSMTGDDDFLEKYQEAISQIESFNDFYGKISQILKNLRSIRTNKLEQSNLIDFFVRRLYIYFQKLEFKEIVGIYEQFQKYLVGEQIKPKQNQFMLTKSIEQVRFNLENYSFKINPQQINEIIEQLQKQDHTYKTSYLKGIVHAQQGSPAQSSHFMRRYFDKNLMNLFPDRIEGGSGNKINHCILGVAFADLQLGHLDQCLQSISEGLRISQNNSDEESINNCIIYLYHVAQKLGKYHQQILLAAHAITHSLNQSNLTLTLYSCLNCSLFQKRYDYNDSSLSLLKTRQVSWKDALHFAKKKLHSHFQNSCRNIFHSYRNLLIPSFVHKLAILAQIPNLKNLLINPYYERDQLLSLAIYRQFNDESQIATLIRKGKLYLGTGQQSMLQSTNNELNKLKETANPNQLIKIWKFENQIIFKNGSLMKCLEETQKLSQFAKKHGFVKGQYAEYLIIIAQILLINGLPHDALVKIEKVLKICERFHLETEKTSCLITKANIMLHLSIYQEPIQILKQMEQKGVKSKLSNLQSQKFFQTKLYLNQILSHIMSQQQGLLTALHQNIIDLHENLIQSLLAEKDLLGVHSALVKMNDFVCKHPVYMNKSQNIQKAIKYCEKSLNILRNWKKQTINDEQIANKIMMKIRLICKF